MPRGRPILITGARGFVGRHVQDRAVERGVEAVAADHDLRDRERTNQLVHAVQPAAVIHLADRRAPTDDAWSLLADAVCMAGNIISAVADAVPDAIVLIPGSAAQYGAGSGVPLREDAPLVPLSPYGAAKCALEQACTAPSLRRGVRVVWARSFNHIGPGQGIDSPAGQWSRQVAEAELSGAGAVTTGRLDRVRDFVDVRDVAAAYLDLVSSQAEGAVNVCSGRGVVLRELVRELQALTDAPITIVEEERLFRDPDPECVVGDNTRLRELTGWSPRYDFRTSLADLLDDWRRRVHAVPGEAAVAGCG